MLDTSTKFAHTRAEDAEWRGDGLRDFYFFGPPLVGADAPCAATEDFASGLSPPSERLLATGE